MEKLMNDQALAMRLSHNLSSKMSERSWKQVAETTATVYHQID